MSHEGLLVAVMMLAASHAHTLRWAAGELRIGSYGTCAEGACIKRVVYPAFKPHTHDSRVVRNRSTR